MTNDKMRGQPACTRKWMSRRHKDQAILVGKIVSAIDLIPGRKIVTVVSPQIPASSISIDVSEEGKWGSDPVQPLLFQSYLLKATDNGSFIVQCVSGGSSRESSGVEALPSIVYGGLLHGGRMNSISPERLQVMCRPDAVNAESISSDHGVEYGDFAEWFTGFCDKGPDLRSKGRQQRSTRVRACSGKRLEPSKP